MTLIILEDLLTLEDKARIWRDAELTRTDIAATVSDYPNAEAILVYREALRKWPSSTENFPDTQPEIENGSN